MPKVTENKLKGVQLLALVLYRDARSAMVSWLGVWSTHELGLVLASVSWLGVVCSGHEPEL